jgi:hypothetical protein
MNRREKATKFSRELANVLERLRRDPAARFTKLQQPEFGM